MVRVLGSLLGRGHDPNLASSVTSAWWAHFYERGAIGIPPARAEGDVAAAIRSILRSPDFTPPRGAEGHRDACRSVRLDGWQRRLLRSSLGELRIQWDGPGPGCGDGAAGGGPSSSSFHDLTPTHREAPPG